MMKVLLSAYACEPNKGSEPGVGWNIARELARRHDVWVMTRGDHGPGICAELERAPLPRLRVVACELPGWMRLGWWRGQRGVHLHYYLWQAWIYRIARRLHREIGFDVVHHVTYVRYCSPSFLALLPVPFVWGPVGGGERMPAAFRKDLPWKGRVYELLRDALRWIGERDPWVHRTARKAVRAYATTPQTAERMRKLGAEEVRLCPESGLSEGELAGLSAPDPRRGRPTFISMGRLLNWKGFHLALRAFAEAKLAGVDYWIVGDGPARRQLEHLANSLGIARRVRFWGSLPREETLQKLKQCIALVHPSLHDSGGWVCLEAMGARKPILCLDLGGPGVQVTEQTGIKIAAIDPAQAVHDMAQAMRRLAADGAYRAGLGEGGRRRVCQDYRWETRGRFFSDLYAEVVAQERSAIHSKVEGEGIGDGNGAAGTEDNFDRQGSVMGHDG